MGPAIFYIKERHIKSVIIFPRQQIIHGETF